MGDTTDRRSRLEAEAPCPPRDLKREARRLERLRAARAAAVIDLSSRRSWTAADPGDGPRDAA
jgi:hypothetical protein